ncbi:MAG: GC-type dockerin domain-anchored protein [Phycisphaerales bacterium]
MSRVEPRRPLYRHASQFARAIGLATVVLVASPAVGRSTTTAWLAPIDGSFEDPARWSNGLPWLANSVQFGVAPGGPFTITLSASHSVGSVTVKSQSFTLQGVAPDGAPSPSLWTGLHVGGANAPQLTLRDCTITCPNSVVIGENGGEGELRIGDGATLDALNSVIVGYSPTYGLLELEPHATFNAKYFYCNQTTRWIIDGADACFVHATSKATFTGTIRIAFGPSGPPRPGTVVTLATNPGGCAVIPGTVIVESSEPVDGIVAIENDQLVYRQLLAPAQLALDVPPMPTAGYPARISVSGVADGHVVDLSRQAVLSSSNRRVLEVVGPDRVVAVAPGRATLTATLGSSSASVPVTVGDAPTPFDAADAGVCVGSKIWGMSEDGRFVLFTATGASGHRDLFVRDLETGALDALNEGPNGEPSSGDCDVPSISGDGRFVAFRTYAPEVIGVANVLVIRDRATGAADYAVKKPDGTPVQGSSPTLSYDGRYVLFLSTDDLVPGLVPNVHVYMHDRLLGTITNVDVGPNGVAAIDGFGCSMSSDARFVTFQADIEIAPKEYATGLCVRDLVLGTTTFESAEGFGGDYGAGISDDGRYLAYFVPLGSGDVGVTLRDRVAGTSTIIASLGFKPELALSMSANGRYVGYHLYHVEACGGVALSASQDPWRYDVVLGTWQRIDQRIGGEAQGESYGPIAFSADGRFCAFATQGDDLLPVDAPCAHVLRRRFGPANGADINGDGTVDASDLALLVAAWGTGDASADLDGDGIVGAADLATLLGAWTR